MHIIFLIFLVSFGTIISQLILKKGVLIITAGLLAPGLNLTFFKAAFASPYVWASLSLQAMTYSLWMFVISKEKLGIAFGVSGAFFYLLMPFLGWLIYHEKLSTYQWIGVCCITLGVILMVVEL